MEYRYDPVSGKPTEPERPAADHTVPPPKKADVGENVSYRSLPSYQVPPVPPRPPVRYGTPPVPPHAPEPRDKKEEKKSRISVATIAICAAVSLLIGMVSGGFAGGMLSSKKSGGADNTVIKQQGDMSTEVTEDGQTVIYKSVTLRDQDGNTLKEEMTVGEVADMASDSVVEITTEAVSTGSFMMQYVTEGAGSGVIISKDGYIVTNHHVIDGATKISVRTHSGESFTARLIGSDAQTDLAVIKIEAKKELSPAIYGEYDTCRVGDTVVAIGNPLGELGGTVTDGIISALDRDVTIDGNVMTLMQTNTAINPGNSGGGLFNLSGQLIGVVNAKSSGEGIEGLGFAIPIDLAEGIIEDIITHGYVTGRKSTGFEVLEISDFHTAMYYRVSETGLYVYSVESASDAAKAGLRSGMLITEVDGKEIATEAEYTKILDGLDIGDKMTITVKDGRNESKYEITIGEYKPDMGTAA